MENEILTAKKIKTVMRRVRNSAKGVVWIDTQRQQIRLYSRIRGNEWTVSFDEFALVNDLNK